MDVERITVIMRKELADRIKELAETEHRSLSAQVVYLLEQIVDAKPDRS